MNHRTNQQGPGGYKLKKHWRDDESYSTNKKPKGKNEKKSNTFLKAKHMINSATALTIKAADVFVQLYCVLATESNEDKAFIKALLLAKKSTI